MQLLINIGIVFATLVFIAAIWLSIYLLRKSKRDAALRRKSGCFKWNELSEDAKKTFSSIEESLKNCKSKRL